MSTDGFINITALFYLILLHVITSRVFAQNIFLTNNGTIKLGDFGSACILNRYGNIKVLIRNGCSALDSLC